MFAMTNMDDLRTWMLDQVPSDIQDMWSGANDRQLMEFEADAAGALLAGLMQPSDHPDTVPPSSVDALYGCFLAFITLHALSADPTESTADYPSIEDRFAAVVALGLKKDGIATKGMLLEDFMPFMTLLDGLFQAK